MKIIEMLRKKLGGEIKLQIKKRDSSAILKSLSGGVVPNRGLQYVMVGRSEEVRQIISELKEVKEGTSLIKFLIGKFGSGKTFMQAMIQQVAFKEKFVVTKADFTPERRLYGSDGKAKSLYTEITKNLSTATMVEGNALEIILEKWINEVQVNVINEKEYGGVDFNNENFVKDVKKKINSIVTSIDELIGGYDFARILNIYFESYIKEDEERRRCALRWLRGEYSTKTEARQDLGVRDIISDNNYYEYIKVLVKFVRQIGYSGLVINLDEAINLYKINHPQTREKNYETILKIFNDILQGNLGGLYITFGGTLEFLEDERKGLFSYEALKSRLRGNKFETDEFRDLSQPVIKLKPLSYSEQFVLLQKLREIHSVHYGYASDIIDEEIKNFITVEYTRPGAQERMTSRDIIITFLGALDILHQNPNYDRTKIFGDKSKVPQVEENSTDLINNRFKKSYQ